MTEPEPVTVADQVYLLLEREILSGRIAGGSRLKVRQLAKLADTSIMPVRDAIRRLEVAGLASTEPNKGARVKEFRTEEFVDIYSVRLLLEPQAAALGAEAADDNAIAEMRRQLELLQRAQAEQRIGDAIAADTALLLALYGGSGNETLTSTITALWKQSHLYRVTTVNRDAERRTVRENRELLDAATRNDGAAAREISRVSIEAALAKLTALAAAAASDPHATAGDASSGDTEA